MNQLAIKPKFVNRFLFSALLVVLISPLALAQNDSLLNELTVILENKNSSAEQIFDIIEQSQNAALLDEEKTNSLGYDYLYNHKKIKIAAFIFRANVILHPNSANVFDSYAEALVANGDFKNALLSQERAVQLGKQQQDQNLGLFIINLGKIQHQLRD